MQSRSWVDMQVYFSSLNGAAEYRVVKSMATNKDTIVRKGRLARKDTGSLNKQIMSEEWEHPDEVDGTTFEERCVVIQPSKQWMHNAVFLRQEYPVFVVILAKSVQVVRQEGAALRLIFPECLVCTFRARLGLATEPTYADFSRLVQYRFNPDMQRQGQSHSYYS